MAESQKTPRELFTGEDIYPDLPPLILDKIMTYHRLANAEIEPKRTVLLELKRMDEYADAFFRKFSPTFIMNINRLLKIKKKFDEIYHLFDTIGHEETRYLQFILANEVVPNSFRVGENGVIMDFNPIENELVLLDINGEPFRLG